MMECRNQQLVLEQIGNDHYFYNEAIKTLRTNIQFCGSGIQAVMFTSSLPDEGKSDTIFSLAQSFGSIGKRVLLIDADIRKSVVAVRHGIRGKVNGLSQYLSGQKTMEEIIYPTNVENMDLVLAGPYSPNPAELLEDKLFENLIEEARKQYDYILVDTPPVGNLIDGAIVASKCDGAVLVIESGGVSYRLVQKVKSQLERSGCRLLGAVLSKTGGERSGKYYNRYYKKYYDKKYEKYKEYEEAKR